MMNFPFFVQHTEANSADEFTTTGWASNVYKLSNSPLRFVKKSLYLSGDILLTEIHLMEGRIRNVGEISPGRMSIGFYRKEGRYLVSGNTVENYIISVAYNGSKWDVAADAPALAQSIHLSPAAVKNIVSSEAHLVLMERMNVASGIQAIAFPMTATGEALRKSIEGGIRLAEQTEFGWDDLAQLQWAVDDLITAATCMIDEITEIDSFLTPDGRKKRHLIALEIERMLWKNPATDEPCPSSIEEFATYFDCSRRRIQQIVDEHFGIGFVALKRFIRLHQVYDALKSSDFSGNVTLAAREYGFEHFGRFSTYFREMFGRSPSVLRKEKNKSPKISD